MSSREMATMLAAQYIEARIAISWRSTFGITTFQVGSATSATICYNRYTSYIELHPCNSVTL